MTVIDVLINLQRLNDRYMMQIDGLIDDRIIKVRQIDRYGAVGGYIERKIERQTERQKDSCCWMTDE